MQGNLTDRPWFIRMVAALSTVLMCSFVAPSFAAPPPDDAWHLNTTFGIWAMSLDGKVGVGNVESDVNVDFGDLIDKTAFSLNPGVEVQKGDWVFSFIGNYSKLEDDKTFDDGRGGDIDMWMGVFDFSVGYTVLRTEVGGMPLTLTPAVGAQITYMKLELNPNLGETADKSKTWVDPYVGGRVVLGLTKELDWRTGALIGGFGVGSDLTWSVGTYLDWHFAESWALSVGYRATSWDYDQDDFKWDMTMHGPWISITHRWF
ncbi:MAG: outer membrane beta-barrel protein [Anaerolineae bacterium]|nr:outer membrane beta-barrel protein [Phycisphaerae bacterium]